MKQPIFRPGLGWVLGGFREAYLAVWAPYYSRGNYLYSLQWEKGK